MGVRHAVPPHVLQCHLEDLHGIKRPVGFRCDKVSDRTGVQHQLVVTRGQPVLCDGPAAQAVFERQRIGVCGLAHDFISAGSCSVRQLNNRRRTLATQQLGSNASDVLKEANGLRRRIIEHHRDGRFLGNKDVTGLIFCLDIDGVNAGWKVERRRVRVGASVRSVEHNFVVDQELKRAVGKAVCGGREVHFNQPVAVISEALRYLQNGNILLFIQPLRNGATSNESVAPGLDDGQGVDSIFQRDIEQRWGVWSRDYLSVERERCRHNTGISSPILRRDFTRSIVGPCGGRNLGREFAPRNNRINPHVEFLIRSQTSVVGHLETDRGGAVRKRQRRG